MWGILAVLYGNSVKVFMQENLATIGIILFGLFALSCVLVVAFVIYRGRKRKVRVEA
jgi:hypothetical protein